MISPQFTAIMNAHWIDLRLPSRCLFRTSLPLWAFCRNHSAQDVNHLIPRYTEHNLLTTIEFLEFLLLICCSSDRFLAGFQKLLIVLSDALKRCIDFIPRYPDTFPHEVLIGIAFQISCSACFWCILIIFCAFAISLDHPCAIWLCIVFPLIVIFAIQVITLIQFRAPFYSKECYLSINTG